MCLSNYTEQVIHALCDACQKLCGVFFCFVLFFAGGLNAGALKNEQRTKMSSESAQVKAQVYNYVTAVTAQILV